MLAHRDIEVCCPLLAIGACDACETVQESSIRLVTTAVPRDSVREVSPAHFLPAPAMLNNAKQFGFRRHSPRRPPTPLRSSKAWMRCPKGLTKLKKQPGKPTFRSRQAETHLFAFHGFEPSDGRSVRTGSCTATLPRVASSVGITHHVLPIPTRQNSLFPLFQPDLPLDSVPHPDLLMVVVPNQLSSTHRYSISSTCSDP